MRDQIRKMFVLSVFCAAVAGVWTLGTIKADLDSPSSGAGLRVDPLIVQDALLAAPNADFTALQDRPAATACFHAS